MAQHIVAHNIVNNIDTGNLYFRTHASDVVINNFSHGNSTYTDLQSLLSNLGSLAFEDHVALNVSTEDTYGLVRTTDSNVDSSDSVASSKALYTVAEGKAPTSHATNATTYGGGTGTNYGHVKLSDDYTTNGGAASASVGASSKGLYDAYTALNSAIGNKVGTSGNETVNGNKNFAAGLITGNLKISRDASTETTTFEIISSS